MTIYYTTHFSEAYTNTGNIFDTFKNAVVINQLILKTVNTLRN